MNWDEAFEPGAGLEKRDWADSAGRWAEPLRGRIGRRYFHPGTGSLYRVVGYVFDSQRERWMIMYQRESGGGVWAHLPEDFDREGRFLEVKK